MKNILVLLFMTIAVAVSAQKITTAVGYNDFIVGLQNEIGGKMIIFSESFGIEGTTIETAKPLLEDLLSTTKTVIKKLEQQQDWEKNCPLKNSALDLFRFYEKSIDTEYRRMMELVYSPEGMTETSMTELGALLNSVTEAEKRYDERFLKAQKTFADKHNFILGENEIQKKIDD